MAEELQGLLDRINKEGLEKAEAQKATIIEEAKSEAKSIVEKAKEDASKLISDAEAEATKLRSSGEADLQQASRDVMIALEAQIKEILSSIVSSSVSESLTPDRLAELVKVLAEAYAKGAEPKLQAMASEAQIEELTNAFTAKLSGTFKGGIEIKPVVGIEAGVKVSFSGDAVVHDFSSNAICELLCAYLNPRILEIVRKSQDS